MPRRRPRPPSSRRYVLRFCGEGPAPRADVARIEAHHEIVVVDISPPRLLLVEARASRLRAFLRRLPGWVMNEERVIPRSPRPMRRPKTSR